MKLVGHLSDEELTDMLLEEEERKMQQALGALPARLRAAAERPESFWQKQRAAISARLPGIKRRPLWVAAAWATALSLLLLAAVLWRDGRRPAPAPSPVMAVAVSDQELLLSVEQSVQSDVPDSLEPAALLAQEIGGQDISQLSNPVPGTRIHHKEKVHP